MPGADAVNEFEEKTKERLNELDTAIGNMQQNLEEMRRNMDSQTENFASITNTVAGLEEKRKAGQDKLEGLLASITSRLDQNNNPPPPQQPRPNRDEDGELDENLNRFRNLDQDGDLDMEDDQRRGSGPLAQPQDGVGGRLRPGGLESGEGYNNLLNNVFAAKSFGKAFAQGMKESKDETITTSAVEIIEEILGMGKFTPDKLLMRSDPGVISQAFGLSLSEKMTAKKLHELVKAQRNTGATARAIFQLCCDLLENLLAKFEEQSEEDPPAESVEKYARILFTFSKLGSQTSVLQIMDSENAEPAALNLLAETCMRLERARDISDAMDYVSSTAFETHAKQLLENERKHEMERKQKQAAEKEKRATRGGPMRMAGRNTAAFSPRVNRGRTSYGNGPRQRKRSYNSDDICYDFNNTGYCKYGDNCKFVHGGPPPHKYYKGANGGSVPMWGGNKGKNESNTPNSGYETYSGARVPWQKQN